MIMFSKYLLMAAISLLPIGSVYAQGHEYYDLSPEVVSTAPIRSTYYINGSEKAHNANDFINGADKSIPVVIHYHGCGGVHYGDRDIRDFYMSLGFHFVMTNFHNRGDAKASCSVINNKLVYTSNVMIRIPARVHEMHYHINWLKNNGFTNIIVTGHSEGAMIAQLVNATVNAVVIHSMSCIPKFREPNKDNKFLQLLSLNDPAMTRGHSLCEGREGHENFKSVTSNERTHDPFAEPSWKNEIRNFVGR